MNVVILSGIVARPPEQRILPVGTSVLGIELVTDTAGGSSSVPVVWHEPPDSAVDTLVAGAEVVVLGRVHRRFFRIGGITQSRTEVVADAVVPTSDRRRASRLMKRGVDAIGGRSASGGGVASP